MKRYWFELLNESYEEFSGSMIPDGSSKQVAINRAKRWMKENGIKYAQLSVNSMRTDNILDFIPIEIED